MSIEVISAFLLFELAFGIDHAESELRWIDFFAFSGSHLFGNLVGLAFRDAKAAADAVHGGNLDAIFETLVSSADGNLDVLLDHFWSIRKLIFGDEIWADGRVWADEGALVALDASGAIPFWDAVSDGSLLTEGDVLVHGAIEELVLLEGRGWEFIAIETIDDFDVFVVIGVGAIGFGDLGSGEFDPFWVNFDFAEALGAFIDGIVVLLDDVHALLLVGLLGEFLHPFFGLFVRHDLWAEFEEGSLEGGIGVTAHTGFKGKLVRVDDVELGFLFGQEVLHAVWHGGDEGGIVHVGVEEEGAAFL